MAARSTIAASLLILGALTSCEKIELANTKEGGKEKTETETPAPDRSEETTETMICPLRLGEGTKEAPYTVSQILEACLVDDTVYVVGYAVGEWSSSSQPAQFDPPFTATSHVLLAAEKDCKNRARCLAVELKSAPMQRMLSLANHPEQHRSCYLVRGYLNIYKDLIGVRDVREGYCLPHFDIPYSEPTVWEETEKDYW
ncbi:MAG: hypothetical protein KBT12_03245 [Bacteroidales bacterium]|nr:hypothetical protein [Candidatus Physcousia equi]